STISSHRAHNRFSSRSSAFLRPNFNRSAVALSPPAPDAERVSQRVSLLRGSGPPCESHVKIFIRVGVWIGGVGRSFVHWRAPSFSGRSIMNILCWTGIVLVVFGLGAPASLPAVEQLTIEQAVEMALSGNPDLQTARQELEVARGKKVNAFLFN